MAVEYRDVNHFHLACGLGGGAKGFNKGQARVGNMVAKYRCLGGIDNDPAAAADFERLAGVPCTVRDMFSRDQYRQFHGCEPPADFVEMTPLDMQMAAGGEHPHIIFTSMPCKGFSGLLSEQKSKTHKYQALNALTLRGIWLALEAWKDDPVELFVFENVPRIQQRGRKLLDQIVALLMNYGYAVAETTHDCGELGNLAQTRKRFLLVARHKEKVPPFLYEPPKRPLRAIGDVLDKFPLPGDVERAGPMHRVPMLQWRTWLRLAFVEAGSDWRSLNKLEVQDGFLSDYGIIPETELHRGALGVNEWKGSTGTITSRGFPYNGDFSVADPRIAEGTPDYRQYGVKKMSETSDTLTGQRSPGQGRFSVADPRVNQSAEYNQLGVRKMSETSGAISGQSTVGGGKFAVADPRMEGERPRFNNVFRVVRMTDTSPAVTGGGAPSAGGLAVADPRPPHREGYKATKYKVSKFDKESGAVIGASTTGNGAFAVADPRYENWHPGASSAKLRVTEWENQSGTVTGSQQVASGALSVADPRNGAYGVNAWEDNSGTVQGESLPSNGKFAVADPRPGFSDSTHHNVLAVRDWDEHSKTVTGSGHPSGGAMSVADPRPGFTKDGRESFVTDGHYGVLPWSGTSRAVKGAGQHDNGFNSVADPRNLTFHLDDGEWRLPAAKDRLVCMIRSLDGTWHRPLTTLELAALQSLAEPEAYFELYGLSDSAWRERIGNAVPPDAAQAIASVMGRTLLMAWSGTTFALSNESIWVRDIAMALSVDTSSQEKIQ